MARWVNYRIAVNQFPIRRAVAVVLMLVLSLWAVRTDGMIWGQLGIISNVLVHDGKVYFIQIDRGLTVLDEQSGQVLNRVMDFGSGWLMMSGTSLVRSLSDNATIRDSQDMRVLWSGEYRTRVWMGDDRLIYQDKDDAIESRDARDGKLLWRVADIRGDVTGPVAGRLLIVDKQTTEDGESVRLTVLETKGGRILGTINTGTDVDVMSKFLGADRVFVVCRPADYWRTDRKTADRILEYDLAGRLVGTVQLLPGQTEDIYHFDAVGRHFCYGVVYEPGQEPECERQSGEWNHQVFRLAQGTLTLRPPDGEDSPGSVVTWSPDQGDGWTGWLPYFRERASRLCPVVEDAGKVFLASSTGEIECVDLATGQSQWVYVFPCPLLPVNRWGRVSWYESDGARNYLYANNRGHGLLGMLRLDGRAATTLTALKAQLAREDRSNLVVVFDPQPADPYPGLGKRLLIVWGAVAAIAAAGLMVVVLRWKKGVDQFKCAAAALLLTMGPAVMLHYWGPVSSDVVLVFKATIIILLAAATYWGIWMQISRRWVTGALTLVGVVIAFCLVYAALCYTFPLAFEP
ncbi:MAG: PQQ-binding-like beta-propeller repeat protein [Phycisphaeraceae bacterium]|nr:PQQ-binding-like beta-propeller repeat protein [Phycisphaeraceae bacterium]